MSPVRLTDLLEVRFVDLWPVHLPPRLVEDLRAAGGFPDRFERFAGTSLSDPDLSYLLAQVLLQHDPMSLGHGRAHAATVMLAVEAALDLLQAQTGLSLPDSFVQAVVTGAAAHDTRHALATLFPMASAHRVPAGAEAAGLTLEEYAIHVADDILRFGGFSPHQRALAAYTTLVTVFGQRSTMLRDRGLDRLILTKPLDLLIRCADLVGSTDAVTALQRATAVVHDETPWFEPPRTFGETVDADVAFTDEVDNLLTDLDAGVAGLTTQGAPPFSQILGWRAANRQVREMGGSRRPTSTALRRADLRAVGRDLGDPRLSSLPKYTVEARCAVIVTDMVGSVARRRGLPPREQRDMLHAHYDELRRAAAPLGRPFGTTGDGVMLSARLPHALQCAARLLDEIRTRPEGPTIRLGVGYGDVVWDGLNLWGDAVTIACRLRDAAAPDEGLVSGDLVGALAETGISARDLPLRNPRALPLRGLPPHTGWTLEAELVLPR